MVEGPEKLRRQEKPHHQGRDNCETQSYMEQYARDYHVHGKKRQLSLCKYLIPPQCQKGTVLFQEENRSHFSEENHSTVPCPPHPA